METATLTHNQAGYLAQQVEKMYPILRPEVWPTSVGYIVQARIAGRRYPIRNLEDARKVYETWG